MEAQQPWQPGATAAQERYKPRLSLGPKAPLPLHLAGLIGHSRLSGKSKAIPGAAHFNDMLCGALWLPCPVGRRASCVLCGGWEGKRASCTPRGQRPMEERPSSPSLHSLVSAGALFPEASDNWPSLRLLLGFCFGDDQTV